MRRGSVGSTLIDFGLSETLAEEVGVPVEEDLNGDVCFLLERQRELDDLTLSSPADQTVDGIDDTHVFCASVT
jgi:hypothetical protein